MSILGTTCLSRIMSVIRLFHPRPLAEGARVTLDPVQTQYISRSLRLRVGDAITLFDGSGLEYPATLHQIGRKDAVAETGSAVCRSAESSVAVRLVQGVSRGERMDLVVQKATELGATRISPVLTEYGVVKLAGDRADRRQEHWQRIAQSACEQCGRNTVPVVDRPIALVDLLGEQYGRSEPRLILQPGADTLSRSLVAAPERITIMIGPEGGFSHAEVERASVAGFRPVSLGPRVLRTETAAIAALVAVQLIWGDLAS